jgi:hypothetical protein
MLFLFFIMNVLYTACSFFTMNINKQNNKIKQIFQQSDNRIYLACVNNEFARLNR